MQIGIVGLGRMGANIARRLMRSGHDCVVFDANLEASLTLGKEGEAFEKGLAKFLGVKASILCNSGSSANLLAASALSSPRRIDGRRVGDSRAGGEDSAT